MVSVGAKHSLYNIMQAVLDPGEEVIVPAPYFRRFAGNRAVKAFVDGVTAAATGAIAGAAVVLGRRAIVDVPTALIALATLGVSTRVKKVPEPVVILAAGAVGLAIAGR